MSNEEMYQLVNCAIEDVIKNENDTLFRALNERIISSHLSNYLKTYFKEFDVDHEYNGDIDKPNDRKALGIAKNRLLEIGYRAKSNDNYRLAPDIIFHRRGTNANNLIVIEVKKDVSASKHWEFDLIKLEHLTIDFLGNHYNYSLGISIVFGTGKNAGQVKKYCYQNGLPIQIQQNRAW